MGVRHRLSQVGTWLLGFGGFYIAWRVADYVVEYVNTTFYLSPSTPFLLFPPSWGLGEYVALIVSAVLALYLVKKVSEGQRPISTPQPAPPIVNKLEDLERELSDIIFRMPRTVSVSGDAYIGKIPFRERAAKYSIVETNAEAMLGKHEVPHDEFYINPDSLDASEQSSAYLTAKASELLRRVRAFRERTAKTSS